MRVQDGVNPPVVAYRNGTAESVTISIAFFQGPSAASKEGWLTAPSHKTDRRGGATFLQSMVTAFETRPRFLMLHQWNEFIGQPPDDGKAAPVMGREFFGEPQRYRCHLGAFFSRHQRYRCQQGTNSTRRCPMTSSRPR